MITTLVKFKQLVSQHVYLAKDANTENYKLFIFTETGVDIQEIKGSLIKKLIERGVVISFPMYRVLIDKLDTIE